jgi:hypothetical protein
MEEERIVVKLQQMYSILFLYDRRFNLVFKSFKKRSYFFIFF